MSRILAIHSFRGGTGKSNLTANLGAIAAQHGYRIGIVDTDLQSPGLHALFDVNPLALPACLNDYLNGRCPMRETAHDVSDRLPQPVAGCLYLIAARIQLGDIAHTLDAGYNIERLSDGLDDLMVQLQLDYLLIDTHPGISEDTLVSITLADALIVVLRPDRQDFQGTAVMVDVARRLQFPKLWLVVNRSLPMFDAAALEEQIAGTYHVAVAGVVPNADEMMQLASSGVFCVAYPDHPVSQAIAGIAKQVFSSH
jgi:MinD-like ATPase involved in chromosome partitioning or flagellar assembly